MDVSVKKYHVQYDVIVAGGGPSGCAAAVAAARLGAKTLLLEAECMLGGMQTSALVSCFAPFGDGEKSISRGIAEEIRLASNRAAYDTAEDCIDWATASPEDNKLLYDALITDAGVDVIFQTTVCAVNREDNKITGIIAAGKTGLTEYSADYYIDCTGDADLCNFAGLPFEKGGESGELQAATLCFIITNIDPDALDKVTIYEGDPRSPIHRIRELGKWPLISDGHLLADRLAPGTLCFNAGHLWESDGTDPAQVTRSMIQGRKLARQFRDALAEVEPEAFANSYLLMTAPLLGVRESRRITGEYTLTVEDYFARRSFPDEIARNCYFIDIHSSIPGGKGTDDISSSYGKNYAPGESHGIPYRCLIPKGMANLLVAGRSISCDRIVMSSIRVMPNCLTTGEAAGTAAALAMRHGTGTNAVNTDELRDVLRKNGAYLPL